MLEVTTGGAQFGNGMNSVVTATASADNQVVYYDHWENGYGFDPLNPGSTADEVVIMRATTVTTPCASGSWPSACRRTASARDRRLLHSRGDRR